MTSRFSFYMPTHIEFGSGLFRRLTATNLPGSRTLIVTGGEAIRSYGLLNLVRNQLQEQHVNAIVWDKAMQLTPAQRIMEASYIARSEGCSFVLALGGGSCMNAARAIALMATNDGDVLDYAQGARRKLRNKPLPVVCLPTQAEGLSLLPMAFLRTESGLHIIEHPSMHPQTCILDPDVTHTVPPRSTGYHALVALVLAASALLSHETNLAAVAMAASAWRQLMDNVPTCVANGKDINARRAVAEATLLAGMAAATCPCPPELSLALALCAGHPELPVGVSLAMIAPGWHDESLEVAPQRYRRMAKALGEPVEVGRALRRFCHRCGLNTLLASDYGFNPSTMTLMLRQVEEAMPPVFARSNSALTHEERLRVLEGALG